jgi:hypothetical protein
MQSHVKKLGYGVMNMSFLRNCLMLASVAAFAACAADVTDIDRTQPDKVKKSLLVGEWLFAPTVIDADVNQAFIFEGLRGTAERIRWDIQEHQLVAYRSYELLINAEDGNGDPTFNGSPVAVFPISSHFDIKRGYNAATGEQNNILEENTTDRPWYERDYMRVDWAKNLLNNPYRLDDAISAYASAAYFERGHEVDSPWRPEVNDKHINIVGNYLLNLDPWLCFYYGSADPTLCDGASSAHVKLSFLKIEGDRRTDDARKNVLRDYETLYYPDFVPVRYDDGTPVQSCYDDGSCLRDTLPVFDRFGFFRTERVAYNQEYGWTRDGRLFVGNRFNIWKKTYADNGELIPAEERETKKVVYYTNVRFPEDGETDWTVWAQGKEINSAWDATQKLVAEWDLAFRKTVAGVRSTAPLGQTVTADEIPTIFELRRNDCNVDNVSDYASKHGLKGALRDNGISDLNPDNLERACAVLEWETSGDFTWQKYGDLRYSFMNWVDKPSPAGPLGIAQWAADPITGEIFSANANVYGAALDTYSAYAADVVQLMNGEIDLGDVMNGTNVREHLNTSWQRWDRQMSPERMEQMNDAMFSKRREFFGGRVPKANAAFFDRKMVRGRTMSADELDDARALPLETGRLDAIAGTPIERDLLLNDDLKRAMLGPSRYQPGQALTGELQNFSPFKFLLGDDAELRRFAAMQLGTRGIDMFDIDQFDDAGMVSLAEELRGKSWQEVYDHLRLQMYRSVMAHEVGHTLGLRHNFQGSFDPLNYNPEFWSYYNSTTGKVERVTGGDPTRAERLMYSSIMDYDARFYADSLEGIGPYDVAAIKFGYGALVESFKNRKAAAQYDSFLFLYDYNDYPKLFTGELSCQSIFGGDCNQDLMDGFDHYSTYVDLSNQAADALADGDMAQFGTLNQQASEEYNQFNGLLNSYLRDGLGSITPPAACNASNDYCGVWSREDVRFSDIQKGWNNYYEGRSYALPDEVPYKFCPDEISMYGSYVECLPYDKGGSYSEVTLDRMVRYDSYYFFTNFKRDRAEYTFNDYDYLGSYLSRLYERYTGQMSNVYRNYLYAFSSLGRDKNGNEVTLTDFPIGRDWQSAGLQGLNFLNAIIQQPEPGDYCLDTAANTFRPLAGGTCATQTMNVPLGTGKYYYTQWTDEYSYKATVIGSFWDKYAALFAMTDNEGFFYRDYSSFFDVGAFQLSYWSGALKKPMLNMFDGMIGGHDGEFTWRYDVDGIGAGQFVPAPVVDVYSATDAESAALYAKPKIEAATSYTLQWYGVVLPMARFNSGFDYSADFVNYERICLDGYADCQEFDGATAEYVDPLTGYRYISSRTDMPTEAIGPKLLDEAQQFVDDVYVPARQAYDTAVANNAADVGTKLLALQQVENQVSEKTALIEVVRDFGTYFGAAWR